MGSQPRHALPMSGMTGREHNKPALALHTRYTTRQLLLCTRVVLCRTHVTQHASPCFAHAWCCAAHCPFEALWWAESEDGYCVAVLAVDVPCSVHSTCCCAVRCPLEALWWTESGDQHVKSSHVHLTVTCVARSRIGLSTSSHIGFEFLGNSSS